MFIPLHVEQQKAAKVASFLSAFWLFKYLAPTAG